MLYEIRTLEIGIIKKRNIYKAVLEAKYMMMSMKRRLITGFVVMMLVVCSVPEVFAASVGFTKAYVEGNSYTYITRKDKTTKNGYVELLVKTMYTTDNKAASYKKSKAQLRGWNGKSYVRATSTADYGKTVTKGKESTFELLKDYRKAGKTVKYYAKGNDPNKDCKITGTMWVDQEH